MGFLQWQHLLKWYFWSDYCQASFATLDHTVLSLTARKSIFNLSMSGMFGNDLWNMINGIKYKITRWLGYEYIINYTDLIDSSLKNYVVW